MASAANPVGPDTPITIKVALGGENRRFKLPLKDVGPNSLPGKLRTLLHVPQHQSLLLERYSDSAAAFVVLTSDNTSVYKQLYRAAKAKLKLRIRATIVDAAQPAMKKEEPTEPPKPRTVPVIVPSEATRTAAAPAPAPIPAPALAVRSAPRVPVSVLPAVASEPRRAVVSCPAMSLTHFSVCCNVCHSDIPRVHWHCSICQNGDYDLCANCVELGHHCEVDSHFLIKRIIEDGRVINATLETISKKFGPPQGGNPLRSAVKEELQKPQESLSRTCNRCIGVYTEENLVTCRVCDDYDLCIGCLVENRHGHHPGHTFVPVREALTLNTRAAALCSPGRNRYHHAICDVCEKKIRGVRHKCFECPDYDLCDTCVKDSRNRHPGHRFAPLYDSITLPQNVQVEHRGVRCDGPLCKDKSGKAYIHGVRYKCAVCHDTDFCAACEALPTKMHNRTHPMIMFRSPVAHASVTTYDGDEHPQPLGDRPPPMTSRSTETIVTPSVNAATQVHTVAEFKPADRVKEAAKIESQRGSPAITCDGVFISDVIADGSKMPADQVFQQTWTIKNPGPVAWPKGCCLRFVGGDRMLNMDADRPASTDALDRAVSSNVIEREVQVGETVKFAVILKAPMRPGKAISYWRIKTPDGMAFGHKLWCEIDVTVRNEPESPTETTPHPDVTRLQAIVGDKTDEIQRLATALTDLQQQLSHAKAEKAVAITSVHETMAEQRAMLLAKLEEVKTESEKIRASQMIFPKLEKESPHASVYENAQQELPGEPAPLLAEADVDLVEDMDSLAVEDEDESTDDGFLTDEEYDILDSEFEELANEGKA